MARTRSPHRKAERRVRRAAALALLPAFVLGSLPAGSASAARRDRAEPSAASRGVAPQASPQEPAPAPPAAPVTVNRRVPEIAPVPAYAELSASPSSEAVTRARVFSEPLLPVGGAPTPEGNAGLARAIESYQRRGQMDDTEPLETLRAQRALVAWRPSLLLNLGLVYERTGRFTRAQHAFEEAWELSKNARDEAGRDVGDRALGELVWVHSLFGRQEQLEQALKEAEGRDVRGPGAERVHAARLEAWGLANRCGCRRRRWRRKPRDTSWCQPANVCLRVGAR